MDIASVVPAISQQSAGSESIAGNLRAGSQAESNFRQILSNAASQKDADKVKTAAKQFEGLIIGQILKSVHEAANGGWMGAGEDQSSSTALELAEEQLAQVMASGGGLGLAKLVEHALTNKAKPPAITSK